MSQQKSDEEIAQIVRTSNKELYREIVERYQHKLYSYALYLLKHEDAAKDVVQQAFIKAYINLNGFDTSKKFSSWIYRIVHNEAINYIKKHRNQMQLTNEAYDVKDPSVNVDTLFERMEQDEHIQRLVASLPFKYREVLILYFMEERSYEEISDILRIPIGTVGIRILRGKDQLKQLINEYYG